MKKNNYNCLLIILIAMFFILLYKKIYYIKDIGMNKKGYNAVIREYNKKKKVKCYNFYKYSILKFDNKIFNVENIIENDNYVNLTIKYIGDINEFYNNIKFIIEDENFKNINYINIVQDKNIKFDIQFYKG